jgi:hypothetical protein
VRLGDALFDGWGQTGFSNLYRDRHGPLLKNPVDLAKHQENIRKADEVQSKLREWGEHGLFRTGVRQRSGGPVHQVAPVVWSTQNLKARFTQCEMNPADPYSNGICGRNYDHVFLSRADFDHLLVTEFPDNAALALVKSQAVLSGSDADLHLSPYMGLMVAVIRQMEIRPDNQPGVEAIKSTIAELAPAFGLDVDPKDLDDPSRLQNWAPRAGTERLSRKMIEAMPTLLREIWRPG